MNQWLNMLLFVIIDCYFSDGINKKKKKKLDIFLFVIWSNMKIWKNSIEKSNIHFVLYSNDQFFIICQIQSSRTSFFIFNLNVYSPHTHTYINIPRSLWETRFIPLDYVTTCFFIYVIISIWFSFSIIDLLCYCYSKFDEKLDYFQSFLFILDIIQDWSSSIRRSKWTGCNRMAFST